MTFSDILTIVLQSSVLILSLSSLIKAYCFHNIHDHMIYALLFPFLFLLLLTQAMFPFYLIGF